MLTDRFSEITLAHLFKQLFYSARIVEVGIACDLTVLI